MSPSGKEETPLEFPLECHFRIIAEDLQNMHFVIETVLMELGVHDPLEQSNTSAKGKYISFSVSTSVESLDKLNKIDKELRLIQGVKMVL
ncbi:hypothetical protein BVX97_05565 [bacterium E08(2017)]|nr:hypothetical protein BVX97_05565 [bacterium E08(2017)]